MDILDPLSQNNLIYAKVVNGEIVEYPVYKVHINNRQEPISDYNLVSFDAKPVVPPFHYAREVPRYENGQVHVGYSIEAFSLQDILSQIAIPSAGGIGLPTAPVITDVPVETIDRIKALTTIHVQSKLDTFAQEKGYDNLLSATSYKDSSVVQFSTEATIAIQLRDQVWGSLYTYIQAVEAGTKPVPVSVAEIEAQLPAFVWP